MIVSLSELSLAQIDEARSLAREKPSPSFLQRKMLIPYSVARSLMEMFEEEGWVTKPNSAGLRKIADQ